MCPAGKRATGGGVRGIGTHVEGADSIMSSYPVNAAGGAAQNNEVPQGWQSRIHKAITGGYIAYAICV
jgi:hypothetical protein